MTLILKRLITNTVVPTAQKISRSVYQQTTQMATQTMSSQISTVKCILTTLTLLRLHSVRFTKTRSSLVQKAFLKNLKTLALTSTTLTLKTRTFFKHVIPLCICLTSLKRLALTVRLTRLTFMTVLQTLSQSTLRTKAKVRLPTLK